MNITRGGRGARGRLGRRCWARSSRRGGIYARTGRCPPRRGPRRYAPPCGAGPQRPPGIPPPRPPAPRGGGAAPDGAISITAGAWWTAGAKRELDIGLTIPEIWGMLFLATVILPPLVALRLCKPPSSQRRFASSRNYAINDLSFPQVNVRLLSSPPYHIPRRRSRVALSLLASSGLSRAALMGR